MQHPQPVAMTLVVFVILGNTIGKTLRCALIISQLDYRKCSLISTAKYADEKTSRAWHFMESLAGDFYQ